MVSSKSPIDGVIRRSIIAKFIEIVTARRNRERRIESGPTLDIDHVPDPITVKGVTSKDESTRCVKIEVQGNINITKIEDPYLEIHPLNLVMMSRT